MTVDSRLMKLSVVIPVHNEEECVARTATAVAEALTRESIQYELVLVDDHSTDGTNAVLAGLADAHTAMRPVQNTGRPGFGYAVRCGLANATGDAVCIVMADASDDPMDVVAYYRKLQSGYECVFGSRFMHGAKVVDYPIVKYLLNRIVNTGIRLLFGISLNDTTNAFKAYKREVIDGLQPLLSAHFNLTVELPLKAIVRGYSYTVIPIHWYNRTTGVAKLKLKEMGSRYLFIVLYALLEKWLSKGDYRRVDRRSYDPSGGQNFP